MTEQNFNIRSEYENVNLINKSIRVFLQKESIQEHLCNAVEICLTEALNNVIKHAYHGDQTKSIEIAIKKESDILEIQIIDEGSSRTRLEIPELNFDPDDIENLPEGGMGLYIIKQLMDELSYYSINGKNYFTLKKYLI